MSGSELAAAHVCKTIRPYKRYMGDFFFSDIDPQMPLRFK